MSELDSLLGGKYIFFKSLQNEPVLRSRLQTASVKLTGLGIDGPAESKGYQEFATFMTSYLSKLKTIADSMRGAELGFINNALNSLTGTAKDIINDDILTALKELEGGRISEANYQKMIAAINAIKYQQDINKFQNIIQEQYSNIDAIKQNLDTLKQIDINEYNELTRLYEINYGRYIDKYANELSIKFRDKFKNIQKTYLQQLADRINNALIALGDFPEIDKIMGDIWTKYADSTDVIITDEEYTNAIIEKVVRSVMKDPGAGPKSIIKDLIDEIHTDPAELFESKDGQASKAFIRKNNNRRKTFEETIEDNRRIISKVLKDADNAEQMIEHVCGDDTKKAKQLLNALTDIRIKAESVPKSRQDAILRELDEKYQLREKLKNTTHMQEFREYIKKQTSIKQLKNENFVIKPEQIIEGLRGKLQIKIKKSSLAELVPLYQNELVAIVFNQLPGSLNMKDDIYSAIKLTNHNIEVDDKAIDEELAPVIAQIDDAIRNYLENYIEEYASREDGAVDKKGTTNVERARNLYVSKMQGLYEAIEKIVKQYPELMAAIKEYGETTSTFLESISVKDYTLYNDEIGYHAGTLGPNFKFGDTQLKALTNIQDMYIKGGITQVDMSTLEFAILNCSPHAIASDLKPALEQYLLGGAALMVFDEGYGDAIPYLENMESSIQALMPKSLNLYFLNQAYVPASYIITSIYTNLSAFYNQELNESYDEFRSRNRVIITNNADESIIPNSGTLQERFEGAAAAAWSQINIQFVFMAGMLEIFQNLGKAFNVQM